jgi:hypothetical protein
VNLTTRSKWLTGIAAAIAAYVVFGPKDSESLEPVRSAATPAAHGAHVTAPAALTVPVARSLLALAHRVVERNAAASLFEAHSWYVAPPPPPPPPPVAMGAAPRPAAPTAPPLPYQFIGRYRPDGQATVFFLTSGDRVYDVHVGDTLENTYSIDSFSNGQLVLTYKPLNIKQQLLAGVAQ